MRLVDILKTNDNIYVEKLTGGKLHIVFTGDDVAKNLFDFSFAAYHITHNIFNGLKKYKQIDDFEIAIGSDYGRFYNIKFTEQGVDEITSVGNCANKAAKITYVTPNGFLSLSNKVVRQMKSGGSYQFAEINASKYVNITRKYKDVKFFQIKLSDLRISKELKYAEIESLISETYARNDLKDITIEGLRKKLNFYELTIKKNKKFEGVVLYSDVNGFTRMFMDNDSNLNEMLDITNQLLSAMNKIVKKHQGVRVQFQGDRISAVFNEYDNMSGRIEHNATLACLELVEGIQEHFRSNKLRYEKYNMRNITLSGGASLGSITATRVGIKNRDKQDNLIIGDTVYYANFAEDSLANNNEVVIHKSIYNKLGEDNKGKALKQLFTRISSHDYYHTRRQFKDYRYNLELLKNSQKHVSEGRLKPYNEK